MWLAYIDIFLALASKVDKSNGHRQEGDELYESTRIEVVGECRAHNRKTQLQRYVGTSLLHHPLYPPSRGLHRTKGESGKLARCICISSSRAKKKRMEDLLKYVFAFIWVYGYINLAGSVRQNQELRKTTPAGASALTSPGRN